MNSVVNLSNFRRSTGIDLNCGCPKSDVRKDGFGSKLLDDPQLIADIVKQTRARISDPDFTVSTKIRVKYPIEQTVDLCRKVLLIQHIYFNLLFSWSQLALIELRCTVGQLQCVKSPLIMKQSN